MKTRHTVGSCGDQVDGHRVQDLGAASFACVHERRMVDLTGASWNELTSWLASMDALRLSARRPLRALPRDHCQHGLGVIADQTSTIPLHLC
jgi:hypothetical protein